MQYIFSHWYNEEFHELVLGPGSPSVTRDCAGEGTLWVLTLIGGMSSSLEWASSFREVGAYFHWKI